MLRTLLWLLVLANLGFFAWSQGWFEPMLTPPSLAGREPARAQRQIHAERVHLFGPEAASAALARARTVCLEAGPLSDGEVAAAEAELTWLPSGSWARVSSEPQALYMVYLARAGSVENRQRKAAELTLIEVEWQEVSEPAALKGGLSLGQFASREAAETALADLSRRGVRNARVVDLAAAPRQHRLRVARADAALAAQLAALKLPPLGLAFLPCNGSR